MESETAWFEMSDGARIYSQKWTTGQNPEAILQIAHGMAEHIGRYDAFAKFLADRGICVYGHDHRGHGRTGEKAGLFGFFAEEEGFERAVDDVLEVNARIQEEQPDVPIFLFGHSMGSFLVRRYIQKYASTISGIVISGTGASQGIAGKLGKLVAAYEMQRKGPKSASPLLDRLSFGGYNKGIQNPATKFDWLSRDANEVQKYIDDTLCGFVCTSGFFHDLLSGLEKIHDDSLIKAVPKDLPMFIFSGDRDPVGSNGKGVNKVIEQYRRHGIRKIDSFLFPGGRHEMLNETNKGEVYERVYQWLKGQLDTRNNGSSSIRE